MIKNSSTCLGEIDNKFVTKHHSCKKIMNNTKKLLYLNESKKNQENNTQNKNISNKNLVEEK